MRAICPAHLTVIDLSCKQYTILSIPPFTSRSARSKYRQPYEIIQRLHITLANDDFRYHRICECALSPKSFCDAFRNIDMPVWQSVHENRPLNVTVLGSSFTGC